MSRSKGKVLAAALAYLEREELEDRRTGLVYDYRKRSGLVAKGVFFPQVEKGECRAKERNLSRQEKEEFCFSVEMKEKRKNSRLAKEVLTAIPAELPPEKQLKLARTFAQKLVERYKIGTFWAIHEPPEGGDRRNFHLHLLLTTRELDGSGNLGQKVRALDSKSEMEFLKKTWMELTNEILPEGKKLEEPQKDPLAEPKLPHLGRKATWFERKTGQKSRKRLEFERQLEEWQTYTSELKELERQRAEQEKLRREQEELNKKYRFFYFTKKLVSLVNNPLIGLDTEREIILPDKTLKLSELKGYSLEFLEQSFYAVRRQVEADLRRRVSQLPPKMRGLLTRPVEKIENLDLIGFITEVKSLETLAQEEQERQQQERQRERLSLQPKKTVHPLKRVNENLEEQLHQQELERRQAERERQQAEQEKLEQRRGTQEEGNPNQSGINYPIRKYRRRPPDLEWE